MSDASLSARRILLARSFSASSDAAIPYAFDLAARTGATVHMVHAAVLRKNPFGASPSAPTSVDKLRERLRLFAHRGVSRGGGIDPGSVPVHHEIIHYVGAAPALLRYAEEEDVDLIVMGTHGRSGARRMLLGSVAEEVVREAPCPVLIVRRAENAAGADRAEEEAEGVRIQHILFPLDFSEHTAKGLDHAVALARLYTARLTLLHVLAASADVTREEDAIEKMEALYREADAADVDVRMQVSDGPVAARIVDRTRETDADLLVMPTHGRTGLRRLALGSVAEAVVRNAPCPVFTVKSFGASLVGAPGPAAGAEAADAESADA
jgi:nucleotide-binding universal stress UspA family protein